jgi:hypothetical protein
MAALAIFLQESKKKGKEDFFGAISIFCGRE